MEYRLCKLSVPLYKKEPAVSQTIRILQEHQCYINRCSSSQRIAHQDNFLFMVAVFTAHPIQEDEPIVAT